MKVKTETEQFRTPSRIGSSATVFTVQGSPRFLTELAIQLLCLLLILGHLNSRKIVMVKI